MTVVYSEKLKDGRMWEVVEGTIYDQMPDVEHYYQNLDGVDPHSSEQLLCVSEGVRLPIVGDWWCVEYAPQVTCKPCSAILVSLQLLKPAQVSPFLKDG